MFKQWRQHKLAYIILVTGLLILTLLFMAAWPNRFYQRLVGVLISSFYIIWGLLTHFKADRLHKKVIFEYVAAGLLAGLLLFSITL